jgi:hypothetical protein
MKQRRPINALAVPGAVGPFGKGMGGVLRPMLLAAGLIALALSAPVAAYAQDVVGKALVDGKPVILYSDKSWAFENVADGCSVLNPKLTFCGDALGWTPSTKPTPDVLAAFRLNDITYSNFIYEDIGRSVGLTPEGVRDILLKIVEGQTGSIPRVIETGPATVSGKPAETMVYAFDVSGLKVVYANTFVLGDASLLQAQTYEIGDSYTDAHRAAHAAYLAAIQYSGN